VTRGQWLVCLALIGCDGTEQPPCAAAADELDMLAVVTLVESGAGAGVALVRASDDEPKALPLCGGDRLEVNGVALEPSQDPSYYEAAVDPAAAYDVVWIREDGTRHTLGGTTPPDFTIDSPTPDESLSRSSAQSVTWSPPRDGEQIHLELVAEEPGCVTMVDTYIPDTGAWTFSAGDIEAAAEAPDAQCVTELSLAREAWVEGDPSFLGGRSLLLISQQRDRLFTSVP